MLKMAVLVGAEGILALMSYSIGLITNQEDDLYRYQLKDQFNNWLQGEIWQNVYDIE